MEKISVVICDDSLVAVEAVSASAEKLFKESGIDADIHTFTRPSQLLDFTEKALVDLVLLDIEMPELDGIRLGKILKEKESAPDIIYISGREDRVFSAIRVHPFGFVRKSRFDKDLQDILTSYIEQLKKRRGGKKIIVVTPEGQQSVDVSAISYFEGSGAYQEMHLKGTDRTIRVTSRMKTLEETLKDEGFIRIHKGYLANYESIKSIRTGEVVMDDGTVLPISRGKTQEVRQQYLEIGREKGSMLF